MVQKIVLTILERLDASIAMEVGIEKGVWYVSLKVVLMDMYAFRTKLWVLMIVLIIASFNQACLACLQ